MLRTRRRRTIGSSPTRCAASAIVMVGLLGRAGIAAEVPAARLDVQAPVECSSRADVAARVASRSPRVKFVDDGATLDVRVAFIVARASVTADISTSAGGKTSHRHLAARSCAEAADAVSLILAVTLDPDYSPIAATSSGADAATNVGSLRAAAESSNGSSTTVEAPLATASSERREHGQTPKERREPANERNQPVVTAMEEATPVSVPAHGRSDITLALQTVAGPAPGVMPGISVYALLGLDRETLWSPALILGVMHVWRNGLREAGGTAAFSLDAASLDACPVRLAAAPVEARPCATLLAGRLAASGSDTYFPAESARFFAAAGGALLLAISVSPSFDVSARIGVSASLVRDSYAFSPSVFHRADALTTTASLGAGMRF